MANPKSVLATLAGDVKKGFKWLGSPQGLKVTAIVEKDVEDVFPAATGFIDLGNACLKQIFKTENYAAAVGEQSGTGTEKAAITVDAITPLILAYALKQGLPTPTAEKIQKASDSLTEFWNVFDGKS